MNNCLECGRLVAPSSGLRGANPINLFCCRKCLNVYYRDQPGLWEREEKVERERIEEEQHQEEITRAWREQRARELEEKEKIEKQTSLYIKIGGFTIAFICITCLLHSCH